MEKPTDYLKRYSDQYRVVKCEDGTWEIRTHHKDRDGIAFTVYLYSDTHLAVMLPVRTGLRLSREMPEVFRIHQHAEDGVSLVFEEEKLADVADALKLWRRIRISEELRERKREFGRKYAEQGRANLARLRSARTGGAVAPELGTVPA